MLKKLFAILLLGHTAVALGVPLGSQHALIVEEGTGRVLFEKNAMSVVPIASLTKLMTAMVVLDTKPDMDMPIRIDNADVDKRKFTSSHVPVGATLPLKHVLQLALMSSDNRAAAALARTYPGGNAAFLAAVRAKLKALGMRHSTIEEPTGLSAANRSTAADLVKMAHAAAKYPTIVRITTESQKTIPINGKPIIFRNTNKLVGRKGWDMQLSKTGFTRNAGKCLIMIIKRPTDKDVLVVLLNASASSVRRIDAIKVHHILTSAHSAF